MTRFFSFSTVLGMVFGLLSITSMPAFATHDPNVIHACVDKRGGVRIVSDPSECNPNKETLIELQKAGAEDVCPDDMVPVGDNCVDKYEASVWDSPDGGMQFGAVSDDYPCSDNGNDCPNSIFAMSLPGETPSTFITWFQAQQACANVGKRLPTNAEWQMAAAGTMDPGSAPGPQDCNTNSLGSSLAGSRVNCVSSYGVFDMVGNLWEWLADWIQDNSDIEDGSISTADFGSDGIFGIDEAFPEDDRFPAALRRGGGFDERSDAGVFALDARIAPSRSAGNLGFRCARNR